MYLSRYSRSGTPSGKAFILASLLLRACVGVTFFMHGMVKVFDQGVGSVVQGFASMGLPLPELLAPTVACLELIGGAFLILGLFTRPIAVGLAAVMAGALFTAHWGQSFFQIELVLNLGISAIAIALLGPGRVSLDSILRKKD